jgi:hypothetical protein
MSDENTEQLKKKQRAAATAKAKGKRAVTGRKCKK